jgi:hypothetical protein
VPYSNLLPIGTSYVLHELRESFIVDFSVAVWCWRGSRTVLCSIAMAVVLRQLDE